MQDESLIDEMRETLRADRERALARRRESRATAEPGAPALAPEPDRRAPALRERLARFRRRR